MTEVGEPYGFAFGYSGSGSAGDISLARGGDPSRIINSKMHSALVESMAAFPEIQGILPPVGSDTNSSSQETELKFLLQITSPEFWEEGREKWLDLLRAMKEQDVSELELLELYDLFQRVVDEILQNEKQDTGFVPDPPADPDDLKGQLLYRMQQAAIFRKKEENSMKLPFARDQDESTSYPSLTAEVIRQGCDLDPDTGHVYQGTVDGLVFLPNGNTMDSTGSNPYFVPDSPQGEMNSAQDSQSSINGQKVSELSENAAATLIQKNVRSYLLSRGVLSNKNIGQYKATIAAGLRHMPAAEAGRTQVYLPEEHPEIVFKLINRLSSTKRLAKVREGRTILVEQKSSRLIVPNSIMLSGCLVEDRLPVNTDSFYNMSLYLCEPDLFDESVREMTRLSSKKYLSDLIRYQSNNPLGHYPDANGLVRYDNLPLFVKEIDGVRAGCIGLIDLEHLQERNDSKSLKTLARIFPRHLDIIKEEADFLEMEYDEEELNQASVTGEKYLYKGYFEHLQWLQAKNVKIEDCDFKLDIREERITQLEKLVAENLVKLNKGNCKVVKGGYDEIKINQFIVGDVKSSAIALSGIVTKDIIEKVKQKAKALEERKNFELPVNEDRQIIESWVVSLRSPTVKKFSFYWGIPSILTKSNLVCDDNLSNIACEGIATYLVDSVLMDLVQGGELFDYDPAYYSRGHEICWIRF